MADQHKCRVCGATLAGDAPSGHCPACLLKLGFAEVIEASACAGRSPPEADLPNHDLPKPSDDYELLARIGQGGMGVVYRAWQKSLNRVVALKLMSRVESATPRALARFHLEARAAAQLDHPNIVPVYETGESQGQPWFSMKLIEGGSLAQRISKGELRMGNGAATGTPSLSHIRQSAFVIGQVARAVHYAHQHGVLHRDLKPANILLDAGEQPYLTDFGIAKLVGEPSGLTFTADLLGTPSYMAPEQAQGRPASVASDVYSLGAILYELLTGKPPFEAATPMETMRQVAEEEPRRPTTVCAGIPRDLETICLKCLEKDPARRYAGALALAEDLGRFLCNEPITARPAAWHEKLWRWCRRKPALAAALSAIAVSVALGIGGILWQWHEARAHAVAEGRQRTRAETMLAQTQIERAEDFFEAKDSASGLAWLAQVLHENPSNGVAAQRLVSALTFRNFPLPLAEFTNVAFAAWSPDGQRVATGGKDGTVRVWAAVGGHPLTPPMLHTAKISRVQLSPDGGRLLAASDDWTARVWDAATGQPLTPALQHQGPVTWAEFSSDGMHVATASGDRTARVWDSTTGQPETSPLEHPAAVFAARLSPAGQTLLTSADDRRERLWRIPSGHLFHQPPQHSGRVTAVSFSPDGQWMLTGSESGTARLGVVATGKALTVPMVHPQVVTSAEFSPDGRRVVTTCFDGYVRVWDADSAQLLSQSLRHKHWTKYAEFSPDGQRVVSTSMDCTVRLWDAATNDCLSELITHERFVSRAIFSPDGQRLLTSSADGITRVWDVRAGAAQPLTLEADRGLDGARFSPDGRRVVTAGWSGLARVWDAVSGRPLTPEMRHGGPVLWAEFSPDGRRVATASRDGTACVWDTQAGQTLTRHLKHQRPVKRIRFSPDSERIVTASTDGTARVWNARTGEALTPPLAPHGHELADAVFSPDGQRIVTACWDGAARVWDSRTGQLLLPPLKHEEMVLCAGFTPDGRRILTASNDGTARFWDAHTGQPVGPVLPHAGWVLAVRLSPQEEMAATASTDGARVWNLVTGQLVTTIPHPRSVEDVQFSPDGRWLATASDDATARLWNVPTGTPVSESFKHRKHVATVQFSPDGQRLLTAAWDGVARIWEMPRLPALAPAWLPRLAEAVGGRRLSALRQLEVVPVKEFLELKEQVGQSTATDPYTQWAKWFFADRSTRPQSPGSPVTISDHVQRLLDKNTEASLRHALQISPTNRAAFARLGGILRTNNPSASRLAEAEWCERKAKEPVLQ